MWLVEVVQLLKVGNAKDLFFGLVLKCKFFFRIIFVTSFPTFREIALKLNLKIKL